jgi:hypothetical protein
MGRARAIWPESPQAPTVPAVAALASRTTRPGLTPQPPGDHLEEPRALLSVQVGPDLQHMLGEPLVDLGHLLTHAAHPLADVFGLGVGLKEVRQLQPLDLQRAVQPTHLGVELRVGLADLLQLIRAEVQEVGQASAAWVGPVGRRSSRARVGRRCRPAARTGRTAATRWTTPAAWALTGEADRR